jgi:hypothetical protein
MGDSAARFQWSDRPTVIRSGTPISCTINKFRIVRERESIESKEKGGEGKNMINRGSQVRRSTGSLVTARAVSVHPVGQVIRNEFLLGLTAITDSHMKKRDEGHDSVSVRDLFFMDGISKILWYSAPLSTYSTPL